MTPRAPELTRYLAAFEELIRVLNVRPEIPVPALLTGELDLAWEAMSAGQQDQAERLVAETGGKVPLRGA